MSPTVTPTLAERNGASRRGVLAAAAWSAPLILITAAAPAQASSTTLDITLESGCFENVGAPSLRANGVLPAGTVIELTATPGFGIYAVRFDSPIERFLGTSTATYTLEAALDLGQHVTFFGINENFELAPQLTGTIALPDSSPGSAVSVTDDISLCQNVPL
ncbi:hypothetical protein [Pseudoclavibacter helvolus]|uniref:hypothetical protein n=1 Tax=Pseudoclavibacter helvolus TaxID=255205 RepID=UPI003C75E766